MTDARLDPSPPPSPPGEDGLVAAQRLESEARGALCEHAARCGADARARLGGFDAGWVDRLLQDQHAVRFPTELRFDASVLEAGEFAVALMSGQVPADGFVLFVDPALRGRPEDLPFVVAYHLVTVNYGEAATPDAAEAFGAALCGVTPDEFYRRVCEIADALPASTTAGLSGSAGCGGACSCGH